MPTTFDLINAYRVAIRQRKAAEQALAEAEQGYRDAVEGLHARLCEQGPIALQMVVYSAGRNSAGIPEILEKSFRYATDLSDPLSVVEATRVRLFRDSRPVIEPEPDVDDLVEESAHVVEVGHRNGPRLIGRDL